MKKTDKWESIDKNSIAYKKYIAHHDPNSPENVKKRKAERAKARKEWLSKNWIGLAGLIVAIIAVVISLVHTG